MAQQLTPQILIRLILVKQAYYKAVQSASEQTDIGNIFAIQELDFAIETLLKTVISHKGSPTTYNGSQSYYKYKLTQLTNEPYRDDSPFPRLFDEIVGIYRDSSKGINKDAPPFRQEIELIHEMRNDAQHKGVSPSSTEVQKRFGFGESFITSVLNDVFNFTIEQITLASLISDTDVRSYFQKADDALNSSNFKESIINARIAFNNGMRIARESFLGHRQWWFGHDIERISRDIAEAIRDVREEMEPLLLGVDSISYLEFLRKSPPVYQTLDGTPHVQARDNWNPTKEDAIMVLNFVFSTLMRWRI